MDNFKKFKSEANKWIDELGLKHIDVKFNQTCPPDAIAYAQYFRESFTAILSLTRSLPKNTNISTVALHEVLHILLWDAIEGNDKERAEEEAIRRLTRLILKYATKTNRK